MILLILIGILSSAWVMLTLLAQQERKADPFTIGKEGPDVPTALMIYNPDLFYDLDKQVCRAMADGLAINGWYTQVLTVTDARQKDLSEFKLLVFCANTYNWAPDRPVSNFIRKAEGIGGKPVVAITLGSGSTARAQRLLEIRLKEKGARLMASKSLWLMKPNDPSDAERSNIALARSIARTLGTEIAIRMEKGPVIMEP